MPAPESLGRGICAFIIHAQPRVPARGAVINSTVPRLKTQAGNTRRRYCACRARRRQNSRRRSSNPQTPRFSRRHCDKHILGALLREIPLRNQPSRVRKIGGEINNPQKLHQSFASNCRYTEKNVCPRKYSPWDLCSHNPRPAAQTLYPRNTRWRNL